VISGTPTAAGTYTGTVTASNGFFYPDAGQAFSITVLPRRTISIADRGGREGSSGSATFAFPITISAPVPAGQTVSVAVSTEDVSATAGSDYTAVSTTVTWNPGDPLTKNVNVAVTGDARKEGTETFRLNLTSPLNAVLADTSATGRILDDDDSFYVAVTDTAVKEGNSGTVNAAFRVTLSAAPVAGQTVAVNIATADGTGTAGSDYTALSTTLIWGPGDSLTKVVNVVVNGDTAVEPAELFTLNLSAPTGYTTLSDTRGTATITNDD
jgi:hypothetical protein